jgi:hypothetical protein
LIAFDKFFSLIGKIQLSLTAAQEVASNMRRPEYATRLPPQLRGSATPPAAQSSDPVCTWILACYEFSGREEREVRKNLDRIVAAVGNPGVQQALVPVADPERIRATLSALRIPFAEVFHYDAQRQAIVPQVQGR